MWFFYLFASWFRSSKFWPILNFWPTFISLVNLFPLRHIWFTTPFSKQPSTVKMECIVHRSFSLFVQSFLFLQPTDIYCAGFGTENWETMWDFFVLFTWFWDYEETRQIPDADQSDCHLCYASNLLDFAHFPFYFWHVWYPHVWILCFKKLNFITSDLNKKYRNEPCVLTVPTSWNLVAKCTTAVTYVKQSNLTFLSVSESSDSMRYETYCFWAFGVYFLFLEWYLWWSEIFVPNE